MSAIKEMIRKRAYELWERAGCPDRRSYEFWFAARAEIEPAESLDAEKPGAQAPPAVEKSPKAQASAKPKARRS